MQIKIRYSFRNPAEWRVPSAELYEKTLDQIAWADEAGFDEVTLSEHHFRDDGFLPGLLVMAAAIAARTKRIKIGTEIMLLPLHHPVRVAEDGALVDIISGGRFELSVGAGYREEEYAAFGMNLSERARRMEECLQIIRGLWTNEEFSFDGEFYRLDKVRMTPRPIHRGPKLILGGDVEAVARRAARLADGFMPTNNAIWDVYYDELERLGRPVERVPPAPLPPMFIFLSESADRDWPRIRPHAAYEIDQYKQMGAYWVPDTVDDDFLRAMYPIWTLAQARDILIKRQERYPHSSFTFSPLLAGMDPAMAQQSLELFAEDVMPAVRAAAA